MWHNLAFVAGFLKLFCNRFCSPAIFLWTHPDPVQRIRTGLQPAQKGSVSLVPQACREALGILLAGKAAELYGPHAG